jgi:hypothetical protein
MGWLTKELGVQFPEGTRFFSSAVSRLALKPTHPAVQQLPGASSSGAEWPGHEAERHLCIVPTLKMYGAIRLHGMVLN